MNSSKIINKHCIGLVHFIVCFCTVHVSLKIFKGARNGLGGEKPPLPSLKYAYVYIHIGIAIAIQHFNPK